MIRPFFLRVDAERKRSAFVVSAHGMQASSEVYLSAFMDIRAGKKEAYIVNR